MREIKKECKAQVAVLLITICGSLMLVNGASAQQDETDPQRWGRVKTWSGTFTYICNDSRTGTLEGITTELTWNDSIGGSFNLTTLNNSQPNRYIWNGKGACGGTIDEETILTDQDGSCTYTWEHSQPPPLVPVSGYSLAINVSNGTYYFQAETIQWPNVEVTTCCDDDCSTSSTVYGNGGINSSFQTLPASGFSLKGSYNGVLQIGMYQLTATVTWDIRATEVSPPPPSACPIKNSVGSRQQLAPLYALRNRLMQSEEGRSIMELYYKHAAEASVLLLHNHALREKIKNLVMHYAASAEFARPGEPVAVSYELIEQTASLLNDLKSDAGPSLVITIDQGLETINNPALLNELGVTVY